MTLTVSEGPLIKTERDTETKREIDDAVEVTPSDSLLVSLKLFNTPLIALNLCFD